MIFDGRNYDDEEDAIAQMVAQEKRDAARNSSNIDFLMRKYIASIKKIHELEKRNKYLCAQLRLAKSNERRMAGVPDAKKENGDNDGR